MSICFPPHLANAVPVSIDTALHIREVISGWLSPPVSRSSPVAGPVFRLTALIVLVATLNPVYHHSRTYLNLISIDLDINCQRQSTQGEGV
jgi:hypothetical protein